jgi:protein O-GlcNAcase/histone acetyltransferase
MTTFQSGVIEGFYGPPWTPAERLVLLDWMAAWGLNTYLYAPKDDLHHRALWREPYAAADAHALADLVVACRQRNIRFVYGLGPGLDIRYTDATEQVRLRERVAQMLALGCDHLALLFDDIPDHMDPAALARWGSLASAQCHVANVLFTWLREQKPGARFAFCPTPYCGRMAAARRSSRRRSRWLTCRECGPC